jgi:sugar lactone lactonase YvrE
MAGMALAAIAGCGASDADSCLAGAGDGMLTVNISGRNPGAVSVEGVPGTLTASATITLSAGLHEVSANRVTSPQAGITSLVFDASVDRPTVCVEAGATSVVNVAYAPVPTSGKLWVGIGNAPDDSSMLGFEPASVAATRTSVADVAANTGGSDGFTFDRAGNMWVLGGTAADPPLARYRAVSFASDGDKDPDVIIDSLSFGASIPGPKVVAFDGAGNLWVSVVADGKVVMFTAAQIAVTGHPTATVERTGIGSPQGLAFDSAGNLWVAAQDDEALIRIDAANLATSGSGGDLAITVQTPSDIKTLRPVGLAFDGTGNLWVNHEGTIVRIPVADQAGTGAKTIMPTIQITTDTLTLPVGIAFDQDGGLWFAHEAGKFARLGPTQLGASGEVTPEVIVSSPDVGFASWFAVYPAPPSTPLYHKVP